MCSAHFCALTAGSLARVSASAGSWSWECGEQAGGWPSHGVSTQRFRAESKPPASMHLQRAARAAQRIRPSWHPMCVERARLHTHR